MKKFYTLLVVAFIGFVGNAQIVTIPDANFKSRLLAASSTLNIAYNAAGNRIKIDTNNDGNIQVSEALTVYKLVINNRSIADLTGIESFTNINNLQCHFNQLSDLNVTALTSLTELKCHNNALTSLNVTGLTSLTVLDCATNQLASLNVTSLNALITFNCSGNLLTSLNVSGLANLSNLGCNNNQLTSLNLAGLTGLLNVNCSRNQLTALEVSMLTNLKGLQCFQNQLSALNVTGLPLTTLFCGANNIPVLDIGNMQLIQLGCEENELTTLDLNNSINTLTYLSFGDNHITSLDLNVFTHLTFLSCGPNPLAGINISSLTNLTELFVAGLDPAIFPLAAINSGTFPLLKTLCCDDSQLGPATTFNLSVYPDLEIFTCRNMGLSNLNISHPNIHSLYCENNNLTSVNVSGIPQLTQFTCYNNQLTALDLSNNTGLFNLGVGGNPLTELDLSSLPELYYISVSNSPQLTSFNIKNGSTEGTINFVNCPNIQYVCGDDGDINSIQTKITQYGYANCHTNTYCSFIPGGASYTIQGNSKFDSNNNGCDASDFNFSNLKLNFINGTVTGSLIGTAAGNYHNTVQAGTHSFSPVLENPSYFTVSPATATVTFPTAASPFLQDFCIAANGTHNDLEVILMPMGNARPGFDAKYKIIYKNKGTTTQSGNVRLDFTDSVMDLVTSNPAASSQAANSMTWNFSNLLPFESRAITLTFNLNSPTETPALIDGNHLTYTATIIGTTDETIVDNTSELVQNVVNSFDPNEKTCIEGVVLLTAKVGDYVHYIINFENTGSANAENIVVRDVIDTAKFDIDSLIPLDGSHIFQTKISSTNKVEFIFEDINLPFDSGNNHGYIAFKIKTKATLVHGDTFSNSASIYFDYNAPIITDPYTVAVFNPLSTSDFDFRSIFSLSPVPAKDNLTITAKQNVVISSVTIYNSLGQLVQINTNPSETIDVSGLKTGSYFIKIISDKGTASSKFVKE
ncbi:MAG: T9SS type A sorting domain-containing protein [Flavobacterium sp. JAD_PAG50586_2]|nr:MAG: T9SS type A sorting domain-containing protein [Flavobacterium sp. JAD_PAG50586_2]